jgi:hypothetical protein
MAFFNRIDKTEFDVFDSKLLSIFLKLDPAWFVCISLVMEDKVPWKLAIIVFTQSNKSVELDSDWYIPSQRGLVVFKPHVRITVDEVGCHITVEVVLDHL